LAEVQRQAQAEMMKAISLGVGTYASVLASLYLAAVAVKQYLTGGVAAPSLVKSKAAAAWSGNAGKILESGRPCFVL
jgi:hypothetical protein